MLSNSSYFSPADLYCSYWVKGQVSPLVFFSKGEESPHILSTKSILNVLKIRLDKVFVK